ncbi:MAG: hypothetical protein HY911_11685 [Desulfobacterales bacterium]|nr:hypothetical protein [Desulfobacterales bacterium]
MPSKIFTVALLLLMALGCGGGQVDTPAAVPASDAKGRYPVIYPTGRAIKFPEDQVIKKELHVTTQWQTITFEKPLKINRQGIMGLHLVVDKEPYISTIDVHPLNPECNTPDCAIDAACLRRLSDGALVRPEAVLIGNNGVEVSIRPNGHLYPFFDHHVMTMSLGTFKDVNSPPPDFPESIQSFTALRLRATEPFTVRYLWWQVDEHPEIYSR